MAAWWVERAWTQTNSLACPVPATPRDVGLNPGVSFAPMITVLTIVLAVLLAITSSLLVVLILLHRGKGGGLSDLFGGGVTSSIGGSSVAEKNLDRLTVGIGLVWAASIVAVGLIIST